MPENPRQVFCLSTKRKIGIAALLALVAAVPANDIYDLFVTGTYDFDAPTRGRGGYPRGSISLLSWPITLWFYWTFFPLWKHFGKEPLFALTSDTIETPSGSVAESEVTTIKMRAFRSDALLTTKTKSISFHPQYASGGLAALRDRYGDRFNRGIFLK